MKSLFPGLAGFNLDWGKDNFLLWKFSSILGFGHRVQGPINKVVCVVLIEMVLWGKREFIKHLFGQHCIKDFMGCLIVLAGLDCYAGYGVGEKPIYIRRSHKLFHGVPLWRHFVSIWRMQKVVEMKMRIPKWWKHVCQSFNLCFFANKVVLPC